ncbi:alanine and glycine-rich protein-like [Tripterygium wilfordii]|uniref:alanine and glycine-rich protein-like n=1 Tax=Tripterygium wilfordii TaxID=458696 RepID=UPI0018F85FE2|nr:alanine and glycine-rich protein-like [Tripterygium wilfordii]
MGGRNDPCKFCGKVYFDWKQVRKHLQICPDKKDSQNGSSSGGFGAGAGSSGTGAAGAGGSGTGTRGSVKDDGKTGKDDGNSGRTGKDDGAG